jgi:hypothetical protein
VQMIRANTSILPHCRLVLGPDNSYFALTPSMYKHMMPKTSRNLFQRSPSQPSQSLAAFLAERNSMADAQRVGTPGISDVALGYQGAWWVRLTDGTYKWDLNGGYAELESLLQGGTAMMKDINVGHVSPSFSRPWRPLCSTPPRTNDKTCSIWLSRRTARSTIFFITGETRCNTTSLLRFRGSSTL